MRVRMKKTWLAAIAVVIVGIPAAYSMRHRGDNPDSVLVFPGGNSRETYFTLHNVKAAQAWSTGSGIKVGILDHSFATQLHPGLYAGARNFVEGNDEFLTTREWHGYWMATVLHEIAPGAKIYALNTYSFAGQAQRAKAMCDAITWAIENKLDVLSYSAAAFDGESRTLLDAALQRAHDAGIVTTFLHVAEPGNILPSGLWSGTEDGREPDVNVLQFDYSVVFIDDYRKAIAGQEPRQRPFLSLSSTAPVVAGVVALIKNLKPDLTPAECQAILRETSRPLDYDGRKPPRVLDALAAVERVKRMS